MPEEIKKIELSNRLYIIALILIGTIAISYLVTSFIGLINLPGHEPRYITVSGEGKVYITPDIALMELSVVNEGDDIAVIVQKNTERTNAVIDAIKKLGIEEKDIKTTQYNLAPRYEWIQDTGERVFKGYIMTQSIRVKVRDFTKIGEIINKTTAMGNVNLIGGLQFTLEDPEQAMGQARTQAIEKAKNKAGVIAIQSGLKLVKLVDVNEGYYPYYYGAMYEKTAEGLGGAGEVAPAPQIQPGQQEVSTTVTLTYRVR